MRCAGSCAPEADDPGNTRKTTATEQRPTTTVTATDEGRPNTNAAVTTIVEEERVPDSYHKPTAVGPDQGLRRPTADTTVNPPPPGLFLYPPQPGGVGSDPPCYLENGWT